MIDCRDIFRTAKKHNSDRYTKRFTTYEHLVTMIFTIISGCSSLREVSSIMLACEGKINHLGLKYFPKRSTLSDANKRKSAAVFADIYHLLYKRYHRFLSDSRSSEPAVKDLKIIDSSTITLFNDILKGVGRNPLSGKKKGGIKLHAIIKLEDVPCLIKFSRAATHDHTFLKDLELKKGSYVVFDKGYVDYEQYQQWTLEDVYFVTRQKDNARDTSMEEFDIPETTSDVVLKDEKIELLDKKGNLFSHRRIAFWYDIHHKDYEFITNNHDLDADKITEIYKHRWQIEIMFNRLKQNFPLKYFLGDNQNEIEIPIWVSLIIQLIMLVIQRKAQRNWVYSNMMSVIGYHLMTYIDLFKFLKNPEAKWEEITTKNLGQLSHFDP